ARRRGEPPGRAVPDGGGGARAGRFIRGARPVARGAQRPPPAQGADRRDAAAHARDARRVGGALPDDARRRRPRGRDRAARPPAAILRKLGRLVGRAIALAPPNRPGIELAPRIERALGPEGALGLLAAMPPLYAELAAATRESGPRRLAGLRTLAAVVPAAA